MPPADPTERADRAAPFTESRTAAAVFDASVELLQVQNRVLESVARGRPLEETLDLYLRSIEAQSPGMLSSILLLDDDGVHVRHAAAPSLPDAYIRAIDGQPIGPKAGSCGTAAYRREPVIVEDIATDPLWEDYREETLAHGLRACWSTPILDPEGKVLGTFAMYFRAPGRPGPRHRQLIGVTTHTAAIAILAARERDDMTRRLAAPSSGVQLHTYLNYGGNCEEAFRFYEQHLGGKVTFLMHHGEQTGPQNAGPEWAGKVLHARMTLGGTELLGADIPSYEPMRSAYLSYTLGSDEEADRVFGLLADGGQVFMPMQDTFFASRFAMLRDRFGTSWMLIHPRPQPA